MKWNLSLPLGDAELESIVLKIAANQEMNVNIEALLAAKASEFSLIVRGVANSVQFAGH